MTAFFINSLANKHISERLRITEELLVDKLMKANEIDVQDLDFVDETGAEKFDLVTKLNAFDSYTKKPTYTHDVDGVETEVFIENAIEGNTSTINTLRTDFDTYSKTPTYENTKEDGTKEIVDIETAIEGNTSAIQGNTSAIALKEDIDTIKVMINMLAMGTQPNEIPYSSENRRMKFKTSPLLGEFQTAEMPYTWDHSTTGGFLSTFYHGIQNVIETELSITLTQTSAYTDQFRIQFTSSTALPANILDYQLYFEDSYTCNKQGVLSIPQILRLGHPNSMTYTKIDNFTFEISMTRPTWLI